MTDSPVTANMWRVLRKLAKEPGSAKDMRCGIITLCALERRGLIQVDTTFDSLVFPHNARAVITDRGRQALRPRKAA